MQIIRGLSSNLGNFENTNNKIDEKHKKINEIPEEVYSSGLEKQTNFQDELAKNFLDDNLKNSLKPEDKLNHLATAMCIELYALNIFKNMAILNLKWRNSFVALRNSAFTIIINSHAMNYNPNMLKTSEGIAFYFQYYELLIKRKLPSSEEMIDLRNIPQNEVNDEVKMCAEWIINLVDQNNDFEEYNKNLNIARPLLSYINTTLIKNLDFRTNCFGISQFRANLINLVNENCIADLRTCKEGKIVDESDNFLRQISMLLQEVHNREKFLKEQGELFNQILNKITTIRNNVRNRLEFMKKYENLSFEASSVIPFSMKDYHKYMQDTFQAQFPKAEKVDPSVKVSSITTKNIKPAQKANQKKKVVQNQTSKTQKQKTPQKFEIKPKSIDNDQALDLMKKDKNLELLPLSVKCQQAKIHNVTQEVSTEKVHVANLENKIVILSPTAIPSQAPLFQYADRVREWFEDEPSHFKSETYLHLCETEKFKQKVYHGFSLKVDEFIKDYSFEAEWDNSKTHSKDRLFCIPGEVQFKNITERGLFTFCQDLNGVVYHRHFTKKATEDFLQYANPAFRKVDFPSLEQSMLMEKNDEFKPISMSNYEDDLVEHQKFTDLLRITDRRHGVQLVLFKAQRDVHK